MVLLGVSILFVSGVNVEVWGGKPLWAVVCLSQRIHQVCCLVGSDYWLPLNVGFNVTEWMWEH